MTRLYTIAITALSLGGCAEQRIGSGDWEDAYDMGSDYDVVEAMSFTDVNYDFPTDDSSTIDALFDAVLDNGGYDPILAPADAWGDAECDFDVDDDLPFVIEGMVVMEPRMYFKTQICDNDEKYYGSYYIQDKTRGIYVLGDTKVSHFDHGDKVTLEVRGVRESYDLPMVMVHDVLAIERDAGPIFYEETTERFSTSDIANVRRIQGVVASGMDTFGLFEVEAEDGTSWGVSLDSELSRRGVSYPVGTEVIVTGPVHYAYSEYSIIVMNKGQIEVLSD